jgi:hypothetical protein
MATTTQPGYVNPLGNTSVWVNRTASNANWAILLLKDINAPVTTNNIQNVLRWMAAENPPSNWANRNNPLNASLNTNSTNGTGSYTDLTTAAQNTAAMIVQGYKGGAIGDAIYNALQTNADPAVFSVAVVNSPWSSNHYGVASAGAVTPVPGRLPNYLATITVPVNTPASNANAGSGTANTKAVSGVGVTGVGCASKPPVLNSFGSSVTGLKITACQGKAFLGGLSIISGGIIVLIGVAILARNTDAVQGALDKINSLVPVAAAA